MISIDVILAGVAQQRVSSCCSNYHFHMVRLYGQVWRRCFTNSGISRQTSSLTAIEKDIRNICRRGEMPMAMDKTRQMLSDNIMPSQDCLGRLFYTCQVKVTFQSSVEYFVVCYNFLENKTN